MCRILTGSVSRRAALSNTAHQPVEWNVSGVWIGLRHFPQEHLAILCGKRLSLPILGLHNPVRPVS